MLPTASATTALQLSQRLLRWETDVAPCDRQCICQTFDPALETSISTKKAWDVKYNVLDPLDTHVGQNFHRTSLRQTDPTVLIESNLVEDGRILRGTAIKQGSHVLSAVKM